MLVGCTTLLGRKPAQDPSVCKNLKNLSISSQEISLPTQGAVISQTDLVNDRDERGFDRRYCRVLGEIKSVDPKAPPIHFQINLPENWNNKALQMGGGGYNGTVVSGTSLISFSGTEGPTPLALGYATFGGDSGHSGDSTDASFAVNDEALLNFGHQHLKKTHDVAIVIIHNYFNMKPAKVYFAGASTGGREALTVLQRWPQDYDGVISSAPALNFTGTRMNGLRIGKALYSKGGFLNSAKQDLVFKKVIAACDRLDNLEDGLVSNVEECRRISAATLESLRCTGGGDLGDGCLSDAQLTSVRTIHTSLQLPYSLANGIREHEGYNILEGADFRGNSGFGTSAKLQGQPTIENGYLFLQGSQWARFLLTRDANFNALNFDPAHPGKYQDRVVELSGIVGATDPHIEKFFARGGKLILMHGQADAMISTNPTIAYYKKLVELFGKEKVQAAVQFYLVPGFGHGWGSFAVSWDPLTALDNWVEKNQRPEILIGRDMNKSTSGRGRPLCPYPRWPIYKGAGSKDEANNFACVETRR